MKKIFISILILFFFSCYQNKKNVTVNIKQAIPTKSDIIIKFHDIDKIYNSIKNFEWWRELNDLTIFKQQFNILQKLNKEYETNQIFRDKNIYLSYISTQDKNQFLIITSINDFEEVNNKLLRLKEESYNSKLYEKTVIHNIKTTLENQQSKNVFFAVYKNIFLLSFSEIIIEESLRQLKTGINMFTSNPIKKLDKNLPKYSDLNILIKTQFLENIVKQKNLFLNSNSWSWFDVELEENYILLNGVTSRDDVQYLQTNNYSDTKHSDIEAILPRHIKEFYKYQINNNLDLNEILNLLIKGPYKNTYQLSYNNWEPTEISTAHITKNKEEFDYILFKTSQKKECEEYLRLLNVSMGEINYLNNTLYELDTKKMNDKDWVKGITNYWEKVYYIYKKDYVVLSNSRKKLKSLINNINANQTIKTSKAIQTINKKLGRNSHTSSYLNLKKNTKSWENIFNSVVTKNIGSKYYFFNSLIFIHENATYQNQTIWNFNLENETHYKPQIVKNHYTNEYEILTQDIENNLYLINNNGERLWKKQIGNAILGDIHQIDRYNNKKLQYIFNSKDSIYMIDRTGKYVKPFPLKSKKSMSVPLSLFDYDKTRNYRILTPMENELIMYNQDGKIVTGWEFVKTKSNIKFTPEHFQLFNKDYIIISEENGTIHFLNRKGQQRLKIKEKINRYEECHLLKGYDLETSQLITRDEDGKIISIYFDGKVDTLKIQNLKKEDVYIKNNNHTLILKDKKLKFSSKENAFEYYFETNPKNKPKIFEKNDSVFIAIKSQNENLIYILNQNGELYQNPFFGTTDFEIKQLDNTKYLNLIVGSYEGLIYNYQIN